MAKNVKYSANFERDYNWYLANKEVYTFSGSHDIVIDCHKNGKDAKFCFYKYDSTGKIVQTNEPELLISIFKCKESINFHIKMWAEGVAERTSFLCEFMEIGLLDWQIKSIKNQADRIGYTDWEDRLPKGSKYTNKLNDIKL